MYLSTPFSSLLTLRQSSTFASHFYCRVPPTRARTAPLWRRTLKRSLPLRMYISSVKKM
ncbi:hypothetical protein ABB37_07950 [Leptomonas pyrrhocoris]|uniref:Uncharacterized protein n=1 Tax=Leptomonas pyrrhocoris TaxID=157538 RepID=A0A0M9FUL5_LEPPY|nr:hypothetical protein ABB37_07950 [Leptomonas pyrrhocoris]KPA76196.1 hypothetical protein ABB37_07950 [Leptomonas pyrrhocoris]|eukprot:XP_015654635.1 hypothetical protein ABB37_07950 [Leptomonas pyrrhocoris]